MNADAWTCSHFSLANPRGWTQGDLPRLLRRLATRIAALGQDAMVLDVTFNDEITEDGPWWSATVYYAPDGWADSATEADVDTKDGRDADADTASATANGAKGRKTAAGFKRGLTSQNAPRLAEDT